MRLKNQLSHQQKLWVHFAANMSEWRVFLSEHLLHHCPLTHDQQCELQRKYNISLHYKQASVRSREPGNKNNKPEVCELCISVQYKGKQLSSFREEECHDEAGFG